MGYPALIALFFLAAGILGAYYIPLPAEIPLFAGGLSIVFGLVFLYLGKRALLMVSTALLLVSLGFFRSHLFTGQFPTNHISSFTSLDFKVRISGEVILDPDIRDYYTYLTLKADSLYLQQGAIPVNGRVLVKIRPATSRFQYGDLISVYGYLNNPPRSGNPLLFDYRGYLHRKGIAGYMYTKNQRDIKLLVPSEGFDFLSGVVLPARKYLIDIFHQLPTPGNGHLLAGFLLGEKRGVPPDIRESFIASGTMHLLAVSGSNLALVSTIYLLLVYYIPVSRRWKLIGSIPFIIIFCFMTNNEPSVVRAAVMLLLGVIAYMSSRRIEPINLFCSAALIILAVYPLWLFEVGFQLSFAAVAGIVLYTRSKFYNPRPGANIFIKSWRLIIHAAFVSAAAFLFTAPVVAYHFNRLAVYSILANIPAAGAVFFVTAAGTLLAFFNPIGGFVRDILLWVTDLSVTLMRIIADFFSSIPYADPDVPSPDILTIIAIYLALTSLMIIRWNKRMSVYLLIGLLIVLNVKAWAEVPYFGDDDYHVEFLDTGFSHSLLIRQDTRWNTLIYHGDGRSFQSVGSWALKPYLLKLGFMKFDNLILTHNSKDALWGIDILLKENLVENILLPPDSGLVMAIRNYGYHGEIKEIISGDSLISPSGVKYFIFKPDINLREKQSSKSSYAVQIKILNSNIMFTADNEIKLSNQMLSDNEIIQIGYGFADKSSAGNSDGGSYFVISGQPFLYWKEKSAAFDDSGECRRFFKTRYRGAVLFEIDDKGVHPVEG
ncbi:MAG: DUF4131 domain-containing protein [candidate division Zixibacteria bacterium]|nr:DUF4131 domain-containing protein [candidate division Zixibacteria bacterium]